MGFCDNSDNNSFNNLSNLLIIPSTPSLKIHVKKGVIKKNYRDRSTAYGLVFYTSGSEGVRNKSPWTGTNMLWIAQEMSRWCIAAFSTLYKLDIIK
jgi:hypothetical protein